ncbi:MAG: DegT/DnrJ/EryC1/StrS family aminotransferase, partial [Cyclobacteriaceae bacterium]|nr:DegT/DnrJ/EryC1/StrS family aminotransferase [Cyclobacteriaceae bacterium]
MTDRKIPMVDLQGQFLEIEEEVMTGIREVIMSSAFINGPQVREFGTALEAYTGAKKVAPCGNGTDALQIALM